MLFHTDVKLFLERLREVGLVDVTTTSWQGTPEQMELLEKAEHYKSVAKAMASVRGEGHSFNKVKDAVSQWDSAVAEIEALEVAIEKARLQAQNVEIWGEFDPKAITHLRGQGIFVRFFEVATKEFREDWSYEYPIEVVATRGSNTYFVIAASPEQEIDLPVIEHPAPMKSADDYLADAASYLEKQVCMQTLKARAALSAEAIMAESRHMREQFEFARASESGEEFAEGSLVVIEGWSEKAHMPAIEKFAQGEEVVYFAEAAKEEHNPPVKLKNRFFARLFEPIGQLYMLPRYNELDVTPFFAPFFMIFFGMCFGDAGYGLLLIVAILVLWKRVPKKFHDFLWLGIFLNIATVIFGLLTGNVFGIELAKMEKLVEFKDYFIANENMFNVAIGLGAVQVLFGQILRIFNRSKRGGSFLYGLSSLGWVILFISLGVAFAELTPAFTVSSTAFYITAGIACFLILFMNSPGKNPFINFGKGLYSFYEQATGVIGDLISYVRLFAIGLAGAIIAQVFNALSVGLSGDIPVVSWIVMAAILLIGHGLNIFISILGAFVHPVRLTFVEFYKNAEFEGGSRAFEPFKKVE
ncbi:V-type ATP synthase subunit I [Mucinivorans hirudinis]|uniref:V-type ATP synthase subunit I n=1 Tax=Mucinivorans hirudinis TaxID=1433126 RepID=A0A060R9M3_9BACT|nr:V-type ATP synthase subunit I [Mucinivorans hirudinis]